MNLILDFPSIQTFHTHEEIEILAKAIAEAKTLTMGPLLKGFEEEFAKYLGVRYAFGVSNATSALELAVILSGIEEGDEVLLPAHTFTATALPFLRRKAKLIFIDINPETFVMDLDDLEKKITKKSKVVVPVHLYGLPVEMDTLMNISIINDLFVIEDCAQSPGAEYKGKKVGSFGDVACFSFHSQKNITTLGEGGMIVTNRDDFAEKILGMRKIGARPYINQEKYWKPAMSNIIEAIPGEYPFNFALGEIQALAGSLMLKRLDKMNALRATYFDYITQRLIQYPELQFQKIYEERKSSFHLLPARFNGSFYGKKNDDLIEELYTKYGIKCVVQYNPLYRYELFINNGYSSADCPQTDLFFDNMISFPFKTIMETAELDYLTTSIQSVLNSFKEL